MMKRALPNVSCLLCALLIGCSGPDKPAGPLPVVLGGQEISASESARADTLKDALLASSNVDMVLMFRNGVYEVWSTRGHVRFTRRQGPDQVHYEVVHQEGSNPIADQDPRHLATLTEELAAGSNPLGTDYDEYDDGYGGPEDPRIRFIEATETSWPLAYERIAALFDNPRTGDLVIVYQPYGFYPIDEFVSAHGHLGAVQSRAPLLFAGAGVRHGHTVDGWARSVDIAPTVAHLLGIEKTRGIGPDGRVSPDNLLKWQDGAVLDDVLDAQAGPVDHVVLIINDGLVHSELIAALEDGERRSELAGYQWLVDHGSVYRYGAVVNFPSNTFASHNAIGTGAWSGHHGLVDNKFYTRPTELDDAARPLGVFVREEPITNFFDTARLLDDRVETLHEAVHRSFGNWHPESNPLGNLSVAINTPAGRGADLAILEGIQPVPWTSCPEPMDVPKPPTEIALGPAQGADDFALTTFWKVWRQSGEMGCFPTPPRLTIINLGMTDEVSHTHGPHSDTLRRAMVQTSQRMEAIVEAVRLEGALDRTAFVLTADHGHSLQDRTRSQDFRPALDATGVRYLATDSFVYLLGDGEEEGTRPVEEPEPPIVSADGLALSFVAPEIGATDVDAAAPVFRAALSRPLVQKDGVDWFLSRTNGQGGHVAGARGYSATALEVHFQPHTALRSSTDYTITVRAEGAEAHLGFRTAPVPAWDGSVPPIQQQTYAVEIETLTHPVQVAALFSALVSSIPPVLMHAYEVKLATQDGGSGELVMVARLGTRTEAPDGGAYPVKWDAPASVRLDGEVNGRWFSVGPADLSLTISSLEVTVRDFSAVGIFSADGTEIEAGTLTGLLNVEQLGDAMGLDLQLCDIVDLTGVCDEGGNLQLAGAIAGGVNPIPLTPFVVSPRDGETGVDPGTAVVDVYFSETVDPAAVILTLARDGDGIDIGGAVQWIDGNRRALYLPPGPLEGDSSWRFTAIVPHGTTQTWFTTL